MEKPIKILFVCLGNICRSPAAEGIMKALVKGHGLSDSFMIDSAGTYGGHSGDLPDKRMRVHASQRGYDLTHRSRKFIYNDFEKFDYIIVMDDQNYQDVRNMAPDLESEKKIIPIARFFNLYKNYDHIPDPYYEGSQGFEIVLDLLEDATEGILSTLVKKYQIAK